MNKMVVRGLCLAIVLAVVACGKEGSPADVADAAVDHGNWAPADCREWAEVYCARLYYCNDVDDLIADGWPASYELCVFEKEYRDQCDLVTVTDLCDDGEVASYDASFACNDGVREASCTAFNAGWNFGVPVCDEICSTP